jgi:hypothetical protein
MADLDSSSFQYWMILCDLIWWEILMTEIEMVGTQTICSSSTLLFKHMFGINTP